MTSLAVAAPPEARVTVVDDRRTAPDTMTWVPRTRPSAAGFQ